MPKRQERGLAEHPDEQTFSEITRLIAESQEKAIRSANTVLIDLYWTVGEIIGRKIASAEWGDAVVPKLASYIERTQPGLRGFTRANLFRMRQFYEAYRTELQRLRAEVAEAKQRNEQTPDTHDYSEAETRDEFIDLLLHEAGWPLSEPQDREFKVTGMPSPSGGGYIDYVLWGRGGKPLGLVEAKRTRRSPHTGQQQAKLYADCLEVMFGQRPVIFYTDGYDHWMWDDSRYRHRCCARPWGGRS